MLAGLLTRPRLLGLGAVVLLLVAFAAAWHVQGNRLEAARAALAVERANVAGLRDAIDEQNAAVDRMAAEGRRRQQAAVVAIERAPVARPAVVQAMSTPARGNTPAERVEDIDRRFLESLR